MLKLSSALSVSDDFATEGVAVIGMRGSGKSNTEVRWAEVLYKAGIPFVAVDPKGDWGGIRSSADGKKAGLPIPVFGGITGNFPLTEHLGARIADLLVDKNLSAVLDVSLLTKEKRARFLTDFFERLMERHQQAPHVRCVIMEEAHRYIPQVIPQGPANDRGLYARLKEAAASVLLEGRAWGLGCWAATQRPARLHKDVLEEVGTAVIHRIGVAASNDLKTVAGWVKHEDLGDEIVPSLTKLGAGEAWILAPATLGIAKRVQVDRRQTFDSASTPLVGAGSRPVVTMADIDVDAINEALSDAIEQAKAMDPAELNRRIKELERELAVERSRPVDVATVEVVPQAVWDLVASVRTATAEAEADSRRSHVRIGAALDALDVLRNKPQPVRGGTATVERPPAPVPTPAASPPPRRAPRAASSQDEALKEPLRKILTVFATYGPRTKKQLGMQAGYVTTGGAFNNYLGRLRTLGYIEPQKGEPMDITEEGRAALGEYEPLPTGQALLDHWIDSVGGPPARLLAMIASRWPNSWTKDELAAEAGYEPTGGAFNNYLGRLRTLGLIVKGTDIKLTQEFGSAIA